MSSGYVPWYKERNLSASARDTLCDAITVNSSMKKSSFLSGSNDENILCKYKCEELKLPPLVRFEQSVAYNTI